MEKQVLLWGIVTAAAMTAAIAAIFIYRRNMRRIMERMNTMLDSAIDGNFSESTFDESVLSAVEA